MNCTQVQAELAASLYGDLENDGAEAIHLHLASCSSCRQELVALQQVRQALDFLPAPEVHVQVTRIMEDAAGRLERRQRLWRRVAAAAMAAAAVFLAAFFSPVRLCLEQGQVVLRWAELRPLVVAPEARPPLGKEGVAGDLQAEVQSLRKLVHALVADVHACEHQQQQKLAALHDRMNVSNAQLDRRLANLNRDLRALYTVQFGSAAKGE